MFCSDRERGRADGRLDFKKELLDATGISYGQLYRWKRERLIPDQWFVKRSAFTGQETFLPRRAVERIEFILETRTATR